MRVLIIAEEANPEWVSVPLVGWSTAKAIAQVVDAHIVTQVRNEEAFLRAGVDPEAFTAIDNESVARPLGRLATALRGGDGRGWTTLAAFKAFAYRSFEKAVWRRFGGAIQRGEFDIVHRVTPLSPTVPSSIARRTRKAGRCFVLGPINGGLSWPKEFRDARHSEREWLSYVRGAYRLMPGYRSTRANASAIIVASEATLAQMPSRYRDRCIYLPENAVEADRLSQPSARSCGSGDCLRLIFVGRLVPYKGCDMAIKAAAPLLRAGLAKLDVVGDGPERQALERLAKDLQVEDSVQFSGWLSHEVVHEHLKCSDVFLFPSIREFGGGAVLEAMAAGCVPLIVNYGGPGELVTQETGFRVPIGSRDAIVAGLLKVVREIQSNPEQLDRMRVAGQDRIRQSFTWKSRGEQIRRVYEWSLGGGPKPDFGLRS
ncbi:MAG: glycosyltransferase involved in cell wall biosynthesis [Hyphomicrobiaceae bacterium]|jgi:glycosyltransferase involved in cell wall biosynthesis